MKGSGDSFQERNVQACYTAAFETGDRRLRDAGGFGELELSPPFPLTLLANPKPDRGHGPSLGDGRVTVYTLATYTATVYHQGKLV